jgi:hypothetical protein
MDRLALITTLQFPSPLIEASLLFRDRRGAIGDVIDRATEGIDGVHRLTLFLGQEEKGIVEVGPALACQSRAILCKIHATTRR